MSKEELRAEIADGVQFSCYVDGGEVVGVMGVQEKADVALIRHAYVRTKQRNEGIGTRLLRELMSGADRPILIGTWRAAEWAIRFYEKHGFRLVDEGEKVRLLKRYWAIPDRQAETSVVLADGKFKGSKEP